VLSFTKNLDLSLLDDGKRYEFLAGDFKINVHFLGHELEPKAQHVQTGSADLCFELDVTMEKLLRSFKRAGYRYRIGTCCSATAFAEVCSQCMFATRMAICWNSVIIN
jgi:hypothetical protein